MVLLLQKGGNMKYFGYAECSKCKDQNGPWILINNEFLCEDCYERMKEHEKVRNSEKSKQTKERKH